MDEYMADQWNQIVSPEDHVYIIGDFIWIRGDNWWESEKLAKRLHGHKHFIHGSHDPSISKFKENGWCKACGAQSGVFESMHYWVVADRVLLIHDYEKRESLVKGVMGSGTYLTNYNFAFVGHVHRNWLHSEDRKAINIGVALWHFRPVPWELALKHARDWKEYIDMVDPVPSDG
jgi:calcineurin-like phosphoesterase family protein